MNKSIAAEEITSGFTGVKVVVKDGFTSPNQPALNDLGLNDLVTKNNLLDVVPVASIRLPFTNQTGLVVNWQTDIAPGGTQTYFDIFGDYVEAFLYIIGTPLGQPYSWTIDDSGDPLVVTFDWGSSQSGYIKFG